MLYRAVKRKSSGRWLEGSLFTSESNFSVNKESHAKDFSKAWNIPEEDIEIIEQSTPIIFDNVESVSWPTGPILILSKDNENLIKAITYIIHNELSKCLLKSTEILSSYEEIFEKIKNYLFLEQIK